MKKCPNCQKTYEDNLKYCQSDGTPLVVVAEDTPDDPYKTMVASDLNLPAEDSPEEKAAQPEGDDSEDEFLNAETMIASPAQEGSDDVLEIPDAPEPVDPMKTVVVGGGDTSDNIRVPDAAVEEPAGEAESADQGDEISQDADQPTQAATVGDSEEPVIGTDQAVQESAVETDVAEQDEEEVEEVSWDSDQPIPGSSLLESDEPLKSDEPAISTPEIPKFSEPEIEPPDLTESDSAPLAGQSKPSVPIPSPFDESMPPGFEPPATPPFDDEAASGGEAGAGTSPPASPFTEQQDPSSGTQDWDIAAASGAVPAEGTDADPFGSNEILASGGGGEGSEEGENKTLAIVSLISGIVGVLCCAAGILFGPVALITGYMAKGKIAQEPSVYGGSTFANIGMILGVVGVVLSILVIALNLFSLLGAAL